MVEMAVAFPLLILVLLAVVQLTLYLHAHNVVEAAAQDSLRVFAQDNSSPDAAQTYFHQLMLVGLPREAHVDLPSFTTTTVTREGLQIEVVQIDVKGKMPTFLPWSGGRFTLSLDVAAQASREHFRCGDPAGCP